MDKLVSVVMPCFNDGGRIGPILSQIKKSHLVKEIIIVNDGSDQKTKNILSKIKGITLLTHPKNLGKSQALKTGIEKSNSQYLTLIDSDLRNFTVQDFENLVSPVLFTGYDMAIGVRRHAPFHTQITGFEEAFSGQRALKKSILCDSNFCFGSYMFEPEINKLFFKNYRLTKVIFNRVSHYSKRDKNGIIGLFYELKMLLAIISHLGLSEFIRQMTFAKRLPAYSQ